VRGNVLAEARAEEADGGALVHGRQSEHVGL
jgi:hypothetical protein